MVLLRGLPFSEQQYANYGDCGYYGDSCGYDVQVGWVLASKANTYIRSLVFPTYLTEGSDNCRKEGVAERASKVPQSILAEHGFHK